MIQIFIIAGLGILAMLSEVLNFRKLMPYIVKLGVVATIASIILHLGYEKHWFSNMLVDDNFGQAFILVTSVIFLIWLQFSNDLYKDERTISDYISLACFSIVGGFMMVSFNNLVMLFLGIEILSIPVYVLAGSNRRNLKSNESAFKYFLMGAFASGILLFGMTLVYGASGSFNLNEIHSKFQENNLFSPTYFNIGLLLLIFAMCFKIAAVPFHFWTPDVYEGAPNKITAFMATLVKAFAVGGTFRLFYLLFGEVNNYTIGLAGLAGLTMIVGNVLGAIQDNPKRILAYSSIGHAGFMLLAILVNGKEGAQNLLYYVAAYSAASLLAFLILDKVLIKDDFYWSVGDFNGLYKRNNLLAIGMAIAMLSMAGIPPLSGFFAKYFIFASAFKNGFSWLVIIGIIASLIGVYYYFKFIIAMFMRKADDDIIDRPIELSMTDNILIIILIAIVLVLGLMPDTVMKLIA